MDTKKTTEEENFPQVEVKAVSWVNDIPLRYQCIARVRRRNGDVKLMTGDPRSTKAGAIESLRDELLSRMEDASSVMSMI